MKAAKKGGDVMSAEETEPPISDRARRLLRGAVDLHIHSGPSLHPRKIDHFEALRQADAVGMKAILLKDHYYPTMPIATMLNDNCNMATQVIGSIVLNHPLGGLNPSAVDYALKQGARIVWMPTAHAANHIEMTSKKLKGKFPKNTKKTIESSGMTLVDGNKVVKDEVKQILDLIAEADACVSAGHHHIDEAWPFYREAKARGVNRMFLNHPTYVNAGNLEDITGLVEMGVKIEHSICMFIPSTFHMFDSNHLIDCIAVAGIDHTLFGSDLGQTGNPTPVEGMARIIDVLLDLEFSEDEVARMTSRNAEALIGPID